MLNQNISKIYLASKSPRRRELLQLMGVDFEILNLDVPEEVAVGENFLVYSQRITCEKSVAAWEYLAANNLPLRPVLTADTEVVVGEQVLGKPLDYADAFRMWKMLAGSKHLVITTVSLKYHDFERSSTCQSWVYVDNLTDDEIHRYLATGNYQDKSGAYGIQSLAGQYIQRIDGCFFSIMGLPLNNVRKLLQELAVHVN